MERRQFNRILFAANVKLRQGDNQWDATLVDLSLKGALITLDETIDPDEAKPVALKITLEGSEQTIQMQGTLTLREHLPPQNKFGFSCRDLDIDSATELRRLIELNLADESLLQRDLHSLTE